MAKRAIVITVSANDFRCFAVDIEVGTLFYSLFRIQYIMKSLAIRVPSGSNSP